MLQPLHTREEILEALASSTTRHLLGTDREHLVAGMKTRVFESPLCAEIVEFLLAHGPAHAMHLKGDDSGVPVVLYLGEIPRLILPTVGLLRKVLGAAAEVPEVDLPLHAVAGDYHYVPTPNRTNDPRFTLTPENTERRRHALNLFYRWLCQRRLSGFTVASENQQTTTQQGAPT